ncbi:ComEC/Rec2 family competence protein [Mycoplasmoides fastidiosum]|nr:ComEC/Rec2 family competence protein [Mycoplasmoides fastidiosum]UUD37804.1 ComEC/Rec2 family competence protein [Mycoplasmoides fastidiosum]
MYLGFIPLFMIVLYYLKLKWMMVIIITSLAVGVGYSLSLLSINQNSSVFNWLWPNNRFHNVILKWMDQIYHQRSSGELVKMLILNVYDYKTDIYEIFRDLSILHLVVVSGLHFLLLEKIIKKIFFFNKNFGNIASFIFIGFYWIVIDFKYSMFRVILAAFFKKDKQDNFYGHWAKVAISSLTFNPKIFLSYSFLLSMGIIFLIKYIVNLKLRSKVLGWFLINFVIWIFVTAIFLSITKRIYYFAIFNNFIFSGIILGLYFFVFLTWFIIYLIPLIQKIVEFFLWVINLMHFNRMYYYATFWNSWHSQGLIFFLFIFLYFIYLLNKKFN